MNMAAVERETPRHRDPEWLREKADEGATQREMAEIAGVTPARISQVMAEHDINADQRRVADGEVLADIRRVCQDLGRRPRIADYESQGKYSTMTAYIKFGSWPEAVESALRCRDLSGD